jgi:hypothetical protein
MREFRETIILGVLIGLSAFGARMLSGDSSAIHWLTLPIAGLVLIGGRWLWFNRQYRYPKPKPVPMPTRNPDPLVPHALPTKPPTPLEVPAASSVPPLLSTDPTPIVLAENTTLPIAPTTPDATPTILLSERPTPSDEASQQPPAV